MDPSTHPDSPLNPYVSYPPGTFAGRRFPPEAAPPGGGPDVAAAWQALGAAAARLVLALAAALRHQARRHRRRARALAQAAQVRLRARPYAARNPGFAADLCAAAERHEQAHGLPPPPPGSGDAVSGPPRPAA
jgi:hypothetical protein